MRTVASPTVDVGIVLVENVDDRPRTGSGRLGHGRTDQIQRHEDARPASAVVMGRRRGCPVQPPPIAQARDQVVGSTVPRCPGVDARTRGSRSVHERGSTQIGLA